MTTIKQQTIYGYTWYGAGSQDGLIKQAETNGKRVVKMVNKHCHLWTTMTEENLLALVKKHDTFIGELLSSYPMKVYFDIDVKDSEEGFESFKLDDIKKVINKYFDNPQMAISGSEEECKKSYHIVLPEYKLENADDMKMFKKFVNIMKKDNFFFDTSVYSKNRVMKCIYQKKDPKRASQNIIEDVDEKNHFIGSFFRGEETKFNYPFDEEDTKEEYSGTIIHKMAREATKEELTLPELNPHELNDIATLLKLLPPSVNHQYTWKVMLAYMYNGFTFESFWEWSAKKDNSAYRYKEYKKQWDNEKKAGKYKEYVVKQTGLLKMLGDYYPALRNVESVGDYMTNKFVDSFVFKETSIKGHIEPSHFQVDEKCIIFNMGMGGGKTTSSIQYLKQIQKSCKWITPRIVLANNTLGACERAGLTDVLNYKSVTKTAEKFEKYNKAERLIIQAESLHYLDISEDKKYDIVIDEIETVLNSWNSSTHGENLARNFEVFCHLIKNAERIILLDAFTTTKTINFIKSLGIISIRVYCSEYKPIERIIKMNGAPADDYKKIVQDICDRLDKGQKLYIFYPFKNPSKNNMSIGQLREHILATCKNNSLNIPPPHTGDSTETHKKKLTDANDYWGQCDAVLTNNAVSVGVNFDKVEYFDKVFMFCSSYCNLPRDLLQSSMRVRHVKDVEIQLFTFSTTVRPTFKVQDYYTYGKNSVYCNLIDNVRNENMSDWMKSFEMFCAKTNYKIIDENKFAKEYNENGKLVKSADSFKLSLEGSKVDYPFETVDDYTEEEVDELDEKVESQSLESHEMIRLKKFFFNLKYKKLGLENREYIWNNRFENAYAKLNSDLVHMVKTDNSVDDIQKVDWNRVKVSQETNEYLTKQFNCVLKYPTQRLVKTLNAAQEMEFVKSRRSKKGKDTYYSLSEDAIRLLEIKEEENNFGKVYSFEDDEDEQQKKQCLLPKHKSFKMIKKNLPAKKIEQIDETLHDELLKVVKVCYAVTRKTDCALDEHLNKIETDHNGVKTMFDELYINGLIDK